MEVVNAEDRGRVWERNLRCAKVTRELLVLPAGLGKMSAALWMYHLENDLDICAFSLKGLNLLSE